MKGTPLVRRKKDDDPLVRKMQKQTRTGLWFSLDVYSMNMGTVTLRMTMLLFRDVFSSLR